MAYVIILYWGDIPAQVIAEQGRGADGSDDYLSDWRRSEPTEISDNLEFEAGKLKSELETKYTNDRLKELIANGGFKKNINNIN